MQVIDLITDALRRATVIGQTATPSAEQGQDAVTKLNDVFASLAGDGIDFGYAPQATSGGAFDLPLEHSLTIKSMLVIALCGGYGIDPPAADVGFASSGYNRMLREAVYKDAVQTRTDNAPRGNAQCYSWNILTG